MLLYHDLGTNLPLDRRVCAIEEEQNDKQSKELECHEIKEQLECIV